MMHRFNCTTTMGNIIIMCCIFGMVNAFAPLLEDNVAILDNVPGCVNPRPLGWADSYSSNGSCYCANVTSYDHNIGTVLVDTPLGVLTVKEVCELLGSGPGREGRPLYNDVQCGNGPPNDVGDEDNCPGRTEYGQEGCKYIGPKWNFRPFLPPVKAPVKVPVKVPVKMPATAPVPVKAPVKAPVTAPIKVPVKVPVKVLLPVKMPATIPVKIPVKVPVTTPVKAPVKVPVNTPVAACGIVRLNVWNANTDTKIKTLFNGADVCDNKSISIETIANPCVNSVVMTLTGPNNYRYSNTERNPPYFLFANSGSDVYGQTLARGVYTIVVVPDGKLNLAQTISFAVKGC